MRHPGNVVTFARRRRPTQSASSSLLSRSSRSAHAARSGRARTSVLTIFLVSVSLCHGEAHTLLIPMDFGLFFVSDIASPRGKLARMRALTAPRARSASWSSRSARKPSAKSCWYGASA